MEYQTVEQVAQSVLKDRTFLLGGRNPQNKIARLHVSIERNCLRFSCEINGKWPATFLPLLQWGELIQSIHAAINSTEQYEETLEVFTGSGQEQKYQATIGIGRRPDGIAYFRLSSEDGEQVFDFLPNQNYRWKVGGQPMPQNILSRRNALAWIDQLNSAIPHEFQKFYKPFTPEGRTGGGNGGNGGNGGGNWKSNGNYKGKGGNWNNNRNGGGNNGNWNNNHGGNQYQQPAPQYQQPVQQPAPQQPVYQAPQQPAPQQPQQNMQYQNPPQQPAPQQPQNPAELPFDQYLQF